MLSAPRNPVPIFPLPNLVLFPHTRVPLHVFELRYRTMVRDALSGERVIALALLKTAWEPELEGNLDFHDLGCLARFEEVEWLPNDHYHLVVEGVARVRLGRVTKEFPYRAARVQVLAQEPYSEDDPLVLSERHTVERLLGGAVEGIEADPLAGLTGAASGAAPYECLVNELCSRLDAEPLEKLELLRLDSVLARGRQAQELAMRRRVRRTLPPPPEPGERN